jgi:hypothetical protein
MGRRNSFSTPGASGQRLRCASAGAPGGGLVSPHGRALACLARCLLQGSSSRSAPCPATVRRSQRWVAPTGGRGQGQEEAGGTPRHPRPPWLGVAQTHAGHGYVQHSVPATLPAAGHTPASNHDHEAAARRRAPSCPPAPRKPCPPQPRPCCALPGGGAGHRLLPLLRGKGRGWAGREEARLCRRRLQARRRE